MFRVVNRLVKSCNSSLPTKCTGKVLANSFVKYFSDKVGNIRSLLETECLLSSGSSNVDTDSCETNKSLDILYPIFYDDLVKVINRSPASHAH